MYSIYIGTDIIEIEGVIICLQKIHHFIIFLGPLKQNPASLNTESHLCESNISNLTKIRGLKTMEPIIMHYKGERYE